MHDKLMTLLASLVVAMFGTTTSSGTIGNAASAPVERLEVPAQTDPTPQDQDSDSEAAADCSGCAKDTDTEVGGTGAGSRPRMTFRGRGIIGAFSKLRKGSCDETEGSSDSDSSSDDDCGCTATACTIGKFTLEFKNTHRSSDLVLRIRDANGLGPATVVKPGKIGKVEFGAPSETDPNAPEQLGCGSTKKLEFSQVEASGRIRELIYTFECTPCVEKKKEPSTAAILDVVPMIGDAVNAIKSGVKAAKLVGEQR